jgi:hypothetical protein
MVKRIALVLLAVVVLALPAMAQDFSSLDVSFGYGNYGVEDEASGSTSLTTDRVHGFAMHTTFNLMSWLGLENFTGAYALNNDITLITNTFGAKLIARDVLEGRISPYLAGGIGVGYYTSNQTGGGFSTMAARYGGGIDFNLNGGMAIRVDVGRLAMGSGLFTDGWRSNLSVTTGIVFNLGG